MATEERLPVGIEIRERRWYVDGFNLDMLQPGTREELVKCVRTAQWETNAFVELYSVRGQFYRSIPIAAG